jgi:E3 ubiquitin-protein ligase NRDP1
MGVAYKDTKLTQGPIYPAIALPHCAGCKIKSGLPVPAYFKDWMMSVVLYHID